MELLYGWALSQTILCERSSSKNQLMISLCALIVQTAFQVLYPREN